MDTKDSSILTRFTRLRKKAQQPLTDLTELYSQIANESIYYLKLEDQHDYKKAVQGWKALNTHVLYELTQIEHSYPNMRSYTRDEISIQNGVRELYHKSLQHLERVQKLYKESNPNETERSPSASFVKRPPVPIPPLPSRSMLKTLRDPRMAPNKMHFTGSNATNSRNNSNTAKVNFTSSKPLQTETTFDGFEEEQNLIDLSDSEDYKPLIVDSKDTSNKISDFDFNDYFDNYMSIEEEEMKRLEALNHLEGLHKSIDDLSIKSSSASSAKQTVSLKETKSTPALVQGSTTPQIMKKAVPKSIRNVTKPIKKSSSTTSAPRPHAMTAKSTPVLRKKPLHTSEKPNAVINSRVVRNGVQSKKPVTTQPVKATRIVQRPQARKPGRPANTESSSQSNSLKKQQSAPKKTAPPKETAPVSEASGSSDSSVTKKDNASVETAQLKDALEDEIIEQLRGVDKTAAKQIFSEIVVHGDEVHWDDIAGLESAKSALKEAVVYPFLRPDLFRGLREPVRGMLLFGPPGTGKTMLARAVATESRSTFFSISASSLTSKYLGESEKLVRALFSVAKKLSPSIVFVDEIDSLMGSRNNDGENESSRRIKNEFLVQWSSLSNAAAGNESGEEEEDERVLVLAATNLPWSIDEAARRRFVRRQYIPLPESQTRSVQFTKLLANQKHTITEQDLLELLDLTEGYSGSDVTSLAKDAAMGPLRELGDKLLFTPRDQIRPITLKDFKNSLNYIKPSVSQEGLEQYEEWALKFGSSGV